MDAEPNAVDVLICDEAHRIILDDNQVVHPYEIGIDPLEAMRLCSGSCGQLIEDTATTRSRASSSSRSSTSLWSMLETAR